MSTSFLDASTNVGGPEAFEIRMGDNRFRMFGNILQRYVYWHNTGEGNVPLECLRFDREAGKFLNKERDVYQEFFPYKLDNQGEVVKDDKGEPVPNRCSWSYVILALDLNNGTPEEPKVTKLYLKKNMFGDILSLGRKRLGDPTDVENGWDVIVEKKKTGPKRFDVEYTVDQIACSEAKRPLTQAERDAIEETDSIDQLMPRQTPEEQEAFIREKLLGQKPSSNDTGVDKDAVTEAAEDI